MSQTVTKTTKPKLKKPKRFQVLLLNDDYTTMEFVIEVLKRFFEKNQQAAESIMLKIHIEGESVCGTYSHDVAQTKLSQVIEFSRKNQQPLMCVLRELKG
jgi:ATP-dependent Clp protease adaptor protein ClpS